jgi:hypothetical protein
LFDSPVAGCRARDAHSDWLGDLAKGQTVLVAESNNESGVDASRQDLRNGTIDVAMLSSILEAAIVDELVTKCEIV